MKRNPKIAVIGNGSWATAIIKILSDNGNSVDWYVRKSDIMRHIKIHSHNPRYLSSVYLNMEHIKVKKDLRKIIKRSDIIIFAIPSAYVVNTILKLNSSHFKDKVIVSAIKGFAIGTEYTISQYFLNQFDVKPENFVFIAGPSHAEEVANERTTFITMTSKSRENAQQIASIFNNFYIKTQISQDVLGLEYASILKNIYAIASGITHSMGLGDNFQSVLVSNSIKQMSNFLNYIDPLENRELWNSGYLGDLLVTSYSQFSRNRTFGNMLGKGYSPKSALMEMNMVPEGYFATEIFHKILNKKKIEMPIVNMVYNVIFERISTSSEIKWLINSLD